MKGKVVMLVLISLTLVTGVTSQVGLAQESGNQTQVENETLTNTETKTEERESAVIKIDRYATVTDYEFQEGNVTVDIRSNRVILVKVSDMFVAGTGAQQIPTKEMKLDEGANTITMSVTTFKGMQGVVIATPYGTIGITDRTGGDAFSGTYSGNQTVTIGSIGVLVGVTVTGIATYRRKSKLNNEIDKEL